MPRNPEDIMQVVLVCQGSDCKDRGSREIYRAVKRCVRELELRDEVHIVRTRCNGFCKKGPIVSHQPSNTWLTEATPESACAMVEKKLRPAGEEPGGA